MSSDSVLRNFWVAVPFAPSGSVCATPCSTAPGLKVFGQGHAAGWPLFCFVSFKKVAASLKFPAAFFPLTWVSVGFVAIRGVSVEGFDPKMTGGIIVVSLN